MAFSRNVINPLLMVLLAGLLAGCAAQAPRTGQPDGVNPELAAGFVKTGRLAYEQGRKEAAIEAWQKAVALDPTNAATVNNLALLLVDQHRFEQAASLLQAGISHTPDVAELHYNLAVIAELYLLDLATALSHYQRYRALARNDDEQVAGWIADLERRLQ